MAIDFPDSPTENQQYTVGDRTWTWNGTYWELSTSTSTFTASDTEPVDADPGDIWFDSTIGKTFVNYNGTWVEIGNAATVVDVIADADADTKVQVEVTADSDKIEFTTAGTKRLEIDASGHVIPAANETYDLGSASNRFRDIYLSGTTIDLGGVSITSDGTNLALPPISSISGDLTVDTDTLHVDSTNNRVGVGTTVPAKKLHVEGGMLLDAYSVGEDEGIFFREGFATIDQPSITVWDMTNAGASPDGLSINAQDGIRFRENGGEVARFKDGLFGIGTVDPGYMLDVKSPISSGSADVALFNMSGGAVAGDASTIYLSGGNGPARSAYIQGVNVGGGNNAHALTFGTSDASSSPVERMRIDASGNVGIGTTAPASSAPYENYKLTLDGGGWYGYEIMNMVNGASRTGVNTNDPGILLNSVGMNTTSWATPGIFFTSTDSNFTTERPKYLAAIVGQATSTYNDDGDAGMNINFRLTAGNQGTSNLLYATSYGYNMTSGSFYPFTDNVASAGFSSRRWTVVYAASASINTSDVRDKTDIADLDYGLDFVNSLRPVKYRYADRDAEVEGVRTHMGFIAQEVETVLGDDAPNRGVWTSSQFEKTEFLDEDENPVYVDVDRQGLRYEEMIAPMVKAIQELTARIESLEAN